MKKLMILISASVISACSQAPPGADVPLDLAREYANALYNQQLYFQAATEYERLLNLYPMDNAARANINYTIANIYYENLNSYSSALAHYLKIKHVYKESGLIDDVNKRVVACLERLGRSASAAAMLKETTSIRPDDSPFEPLPGDTVAVVGGTVVTLGDLNQYYSYYRNTLPQEEREQEPTPQDKISFLRDYVKSEVLYNSAVMQQLDNDEDVARISFLQKKQLMIQKLIENQINNKISVSDDEIRNFYNENKDKLEITVGGVNKQPSIDEARDDIYQILFMQKSRREQDELTDRLIETQNARIFVNNVK
ncbi:hypothetical protein ACFL4Q_04515 [candidate division KSB1 bacterium]